jgi:hypothetical protein
MYLLKKGCMTGESDVAKGVDFLFERHVMIRKAKTNITSHKNEMDGPTLVLPTMLLGHTVRISAHQVLRS